MTDFTIKSGSTSPALTVTLLGENGPANLLGATVRMRMRRKEGGLLVVDAPVTIVGDPALGQVMHNWQEAETSEPGDYEVEWEVTYSGGAEQVFPLIGHFLVDIEPSLSSVIDSLPPLSSQCWPVDTSCCSDFDNYSSSIRAQAEALAGQSMRMLTGYTVGGCAVDLRPCSRRCIEGFIEWSYSAGTFTPHIDALGSWVNSCPCGPTSCSCSVMEEVILPGHAGTVDFVSIDGVTLPASAYRVDNGNRLVRTDGEKWPICQNMSALPSEEGSFVVRYLPTKPVDRLGAIAAGYLACEFAKACSGDKRCVLPKSVTQVTRQGITMTMTPGAFPDGLTNIPVVDAYILTHNPHRLKQGPAIFSLDQPIHRVTTTTGL